METCKRKIGVHVEFLDILPFARYETEQDKQGLYHHFQLPSLKLYLLLLCSTREEPEVKESESR